MLRRIFVSYLRLPLEVERFWRVNSTDSGLDKDIRRASCSCIRRLLYFSRLKKDHRDGGDERVARRWNKNLRHDGDSVTVQLSMAVSSMSWGEVKHRKDNMLQQQKEKNLLKVHWNLHSWLLRWSSINQSVINYRHGCYILLFAFTPRVITTC